MTSTAPAPSSTASSASARPDAALRAEIARLKRERKAVILAHYYQEGPIQDVADFVGDSLALAQAAAKTDAEVIAFAGVHFMAETAKILNPGKKVVVPDLEAGCSLDESAPAAEFERWVKAHPGAVVISYINCSAAVKALTDIVCTSSNAEKIVRSVPPEKHILFAPDRHLGAYLERKTGRKMTIWPGRCMVHDAFTADALRALMDRHPGAIVIAHPECPAEVLELAEYVGSTSGLIARVEKDPSQTYIVATEAGLLHEIRRRVPAAKVIPLPPSRSNVLGETTSSVVQTIPRAGAKSAGGEVLPSQPEHGCACAVCPHMRRNTLAKLAACLRDLRPEVTVPEEIRVKALGSVQRMLEISR
ncbi:MAG: Quinolinate synthase A [Planctomycetes bacterium]|nr:Quinolinate synthase A [Planctomycetota bacterium]